MGMFDWLFGKRNTGTQGGTPSERRKSSLVLTKSNPMAEGHGDLEAPGHGKHRYTLLDIDTSDFPSGATLEIEITVGNGESAGSFDLFPQNLPIPTEGYPQSVAHEYDVPPAATVKFSHQFYQGQVFQFGAEGNWFSRKGAGNHFRLRALVHQRGPAADLQGTWRVASWEQEGKAVDVASRYNKVVITGDQYVAYLGDEPAAFFILKLDGSKQPKQVDFTHPEEPEPYFGIYAQEGNWLGLCWDGVRPGRRPTFFSGAGTQMCIRLER
jgi:uncharacterized protein (TIGR03067 family)